MRRKGIPLTQSVTKETLEDLYVTKGNSLEDIAKTLGCTRQMVRLMLEKHAIQRRRRSQARVLAINKGKFERFTPHNIDENFFTVWTPAMAWVLGLIFTDGCMHYSTKYTTKSIALYSVDLELLEKVRRHLSMSKDIVQSTQSYDKSKKIYRMEFYREKMRQDLENLGLTPKKSLTMVFPAVPRDYVRHFIRGCWDGDGSIHMSRGRLRASYICGSKNFIESIVHELQRAGISRERSTREISAGSSLDIYVDNKRSHNPSYSVKVNTLRQLQHLFFFFYAGVDESLFLKRKYDVFAEGLKLTQDELLKAKCWPTHEEPIPISDTGREMISEEKLLPLLVIKPKPPRLPTTKPRHTRPPTAILRRKRILTVDNKDGKMKCSMCGATPETILLTHKAYCPDCFVKRQ